jgi:hypothetical protein
MREIRSYGSVRGVVGDRYPYRDSQKLAAEVPRSVSHYLGSDNLRLVMPTRS